MLYTVMEVSELVGISKQSMYKKLQKKELQEYITKQRGITYISEIGYKLIKNGLKTNTEDLNYKEEDNELNEEIEEDIDNVSLNKEVLNALLDQLKEKDLQFNNQLSAKDLQINNLNERLKQSLELNNNNQILLREKPKQDIILLEEHFQNLDIKLEEVKENMQQRKDQQKSKGFFNRLFHRTDDN